MATKKTRKPSTTRARARATKKTSRQPSRRGSEGLTITSASPSLTVNDVNRSIAWYCDVLGFTISDRWEQNGTLFGGELAAGKTKFWIGQDDWKKGRDRVKGEGVRIYCTTTMDIDDLAKRIKAKGGTLAHEPREEWGTRSISIEDPDGYKITIAKNLK